VLETLAQPVTSGVVVDVDGPSASEVESFTIRTGAGELITFVVRSLALDRGGLPASHLREHLVSGEPVSVEFLNEGDVRVAVRYFDAE
jgi:hypothetical protein